MYLLAICTSSLEKCLLRFSESFLSLVSHNLSINPTGSTLRLHSGFDHLSPSPPSHSGPGHPHLLPRFCQNFLIILPCSPSTHSPHSRQNDPAKIKTCWVSTQPRTLLRLPTWCRVKPGPYQALQGKADFAPALPHSGLISCFSLPPLLLPQRSPHSCSGTSSERLPQAFVLAFPSYLSSDLLREALPWPVQ